MRKRIISVLLILSMFLFNSIGYTHSGRTDSSGGHKDNKNKSGLGSYHYHCGGYPAHLHKNDVCPYKTTKTAVDIKQVQTRLNELGYDCGTPDGSLGPKTKEVVKAFQKDKGLVVDGVIGPQTLKALGLAN